MLKDIKLSTILLLVAVGFLIYCLMKPDEGFANAVPNSDVNPDVKKSTTDNKTSQLFTEQQSKKPESKMPESKMPEETKISQELINQVLAESEGKMGVPKSNVQEGSIMSYQPHDNDNVVGASLDSAFDKPIQEGVKTDVIDLNRNNVKNYNAKDYLPKEVNDDWFNTDFSQAKYKMNDDKLINTEKYVVGVNTVGQSLKNASYDIRGAVNVPKYSVSPWNNSTTEPDYNIKPLC